MSPHRAKVLVVEDETMLVKIYASRLNKEGYQVTIALDGEEALRLAKHAPPDLIVLDMLLPKMNGFEVLEHLRADDTLKRTPVLVLSNLGQEEDMKRAQAFGIAGYMIKTDHSLDDVVARIRETLEEQKS